VGGGTPRSFRRRQTAPADEPWATEVKISALAVTPTKTGYGEAGPDDVAVALIHELSHHMLYRGTDRNNGNDERFYGSFVGFRESYREAIANVVAKSVGLSTDGFSPRAILAYSLGLGLTTAPYFQSNVEEMGTQLIKRSRSRAATAIA
jgi:hypothetical protein